MAVSHGGAISFGMVLSLLAYTRQLKTAAKLQSIKPKLVCTVKYMMKNASSSLRQPVFKGLGEDKPPEECLERSDRK